MILLGLGSNVPLFTAGLSTPKAVLRRCLAVMPLYGIFVRRCSSFYQTPAMASYPQPTYANAVVHVESAHPPSQLMRVLHRIEKHHGRQRRLRLEPRTLDLDLLDYSGITTCAPSASSASSAFAASGVSAGRSGKKARALVLPHPSIEMRHFVLAPLCEIAPQWRHPRSGMSASQLLQRLKAGF